jgi:hypothetical protein
MSSLNPDYEYPDDVSLLAIENHPVRNAAEAYTILGELKRMWWQPDWGWHEPEGNMEFHVSTGGWSGNEDLISAARRNTIFWMMCWQSSRRGGHYVFSMESFPEDAPRDEQDNGEPN